MEITTIVIIVVAALVLVGILAAVLLGDSGSEPPKQPVSAGPVAPQPPLPPKRVTDMIVANGTPVVIQGLETDNYRLIVGANFIQVVDKQQPDYVVYAAGSASDATTDKLTLQPDGKLWFTFPGSASIFHTVINPNTGVAPTALTLSDVGDLLTIRDSRGALLWRVPLPGPFAKTRATAPFQGAVPFPLLQNGRYITVVRGYNLDILEKNTMRLLRTLSPPFSEILSSQGMPAPRIELDSSGNVVWYVSGNKVARLEGLGRPNSAPYTIQLLDDGMLQIRAVTGHTYDF